MLQLRWINGKLGGTADVDLVAYISLHTRWSLYLGSVRRAEASINSRNYIDTQATSPEQRTVFWECVLIQRYNYQQVLLSYVNF